jgi:pSer/pThr/pTyr-binding forkhead associated (FHA) protein
MASLVLTSGQNAGKYFQLANRPLSVGRDPARDIQLVDPKVSRKHFMIVHKGDGYVLRPFESINAVLVNGNEVAGEFVLSDRDKIQAGDTTLRFLAGDEQNRTNALEARKLADRSLREDQTISAPRKQ